MKISSEFEKSTLPGPKTVLRVYAENEETPSFDLLCLDNSEEKEILLSGAEFKYFTQKSLQSESKVLKPTKIE